MMPLWYQWWRDKLKTIIEYSNKIMMAVKAGGEHAIVSTQVIAPISPPYCAPKISKVSWLMRHYNRLEMETSWYIYKTIQIHYTRVVIIFGVESGKKNTKLPLSHTRLDTVTDWDNQLLIQKIDLVRLQIVLGCFGSRYLFFKQNTFQSQRSFGWMISSDFQSWVH